MSMDEARSARLKTVEPTLTRLVVMCSLSKAMSLSRPTSSYRT